MRGGAREDEVVKDAVAEDDEGGFAGFCGFGFSPVAEVGFEGFLFGGVGGGGLFAFGFQGGFGGFWAGAVAGFFSRRGAVVLAEVSLRRRSGGRGPVRVRPSWVREAFLKVMRLPSGLVH